MTSFVAAIIEELRVKHYIKNLVIFLPLYFSLSMRDRGAIVPSLWIFAAFCAASSFVYIINDIADRERDALHPQKAKRPLASGRVSMRAALVAAVVCLLAALGTGLYTALRYSVPAGVCLATYVAVNVLYSFKLKEYSIVDVSCIAAGFVLRVLAGGAACGAAVSDWLLLMVIALSLFMGFGKRRNELRRNSGAARKVLEAYDSAFLDKAMYSMMTLAITFYTLWSIDDAVTAALGTNMLVWSVPLVIIIFLRYSQCIENDSDGDPTSVILGDKPLLLAGALLAAMMTILIYS